VDSIKIPEKALAILRAHEQAIMQAQAAGNAVVTLTAFALGVDVEKYIPDLKAGAFVPVPAPETK
jgi:hypothetical protein